MDSSTQAHERSALHPTLQILKKLQKLDGNMQVTTASLLLFVAEHLKADQSTQRA